MGTYIRVSTNICDLVLAVIGCIVHWDFCHLKKPNYIDIWMFIINKSIGASHLFVKPLINKTKIELIVGTSTDKKNLVARFTRYVEK